MQAVGNYMQKGLRRMLLYCPRRRHYSSEMLLAARGRQSLLHTTESPTVLLTLSTAAAFHAMRWRLERFLLLLEVLNFSTR